MLAMLERCVISNERKGSRCEHDSNLCTKDECDGKGQCKHPDKKDGVSCGTNLVCQNGECVAA